MSNHNIERHASITKKQFEYAYVLKNRPVILEDIAKDWAAIKKWDVAALSKILGKSEIFLSQSSCNKHPDFTTSEDVRKSQKTLCMTIDEYFEHILSAPENEVSKIALNRAIFKHGDKVSYDHHIDISDIENDFHIPNLLDNHDLEVGVFWMQGKGHQSWLHIDQFENLFVQVKGRKKVYLMPPTECSNVYYTRKNMGYCELDVFDPDYEKFPNFSKASVYEFIIEPGELLYIPAFWFHAIESLDQINVSVNFWYRPKSLIVSPLTMHHKLKELLVNVDESKSGSLDKSQLIAAATLLEEILLGS